MPAGLPPPTHTLCWQPGHHWGHADSCTLLQGQVLQGPVKLTLPFMKAIYMWLNAHPVPTLDYTHAFAPTMYLALVLHFQAAQHMLSCQGGFRT